MCPTRPAGLIVIGFAAASAMLWSEPGAASMGSAGRPAPAGAFQGDASLAGLNFDLDVDTDRDGAVTEADEEGEDDVSEHSGAWFAVNIDADGGRRDEWGRLLADSLVFDDETGQPTLLDDRIENEADRDGLAPLVIRNPGRPLPPGLRVFLRVAEQEDIQSIQVYARREPGARAIWGGLGARDGNDPLPTEIDITRFVDPGSPDFAGTDGPDSDMIFAVEGLFFRNDPAVARNDPDIQYPVIINPFDGDVDFFLEVRHANRPDVTLASDHVRMRVVPWLMMPDTNQSVAIFARDVAEENAGLVDRPEPGYADLAETGQLVLIGDHAASDSEADFRWLRDHAVLGFYQLPGAGPAGRTYAALRLPYEVDEEAVQPEWVAEQFTGPDRGVFQFGSWLGNDHGSEDRTGGAFGGNIGVIPPSSSWPLGRIVIGDTMPGGLRMFLKSQRLQPLVTVPTRWLAVGHIDEVFGFTGRGGETLIADPVLAWRLLESIPEERRGASVLFTAGGTPLAGVVQPPPRPGRKAKRRRLDTGVDHRGSDMRYVRIYADSGSGAAGQVARIAPDGLQDGYVLIDRVWLTATHVVPPAEGAPAVLRYTGVDGDDTPEVPERAGWFVAPRPGDRFVMVRETKFWSNEAPAMITVAELLADARLRRLNTQHIAARIAFIRRRLEQQGGRNADGTPFLEFRSVPVIYAGQPGRNFAVGRETTGLTPNLANFQQVGDRLYMPRQFGPLGPDGRDLFESAVREALGAERVRFVDTWDAYHRQLGDVHCATNVLRAPFEFDWWAQAAEIYAPSGPLSSARLSQRRTPRSGKAQATPATAKKSSSAAQ